MKTMEWVIAISGLVFGVASVVIGQADPITIHSSIFALWNRVWPLGVITGLGTFAIVLGAVKNRGGP